MSVNPCISRDVQFQILGQCQPKIQFLHSQHDFLPPRFCYSEIISHSFSRQPTMALNRHRHTYMHTNSPNTKSTFTHPNSQILLKVFFKKRFLGKPFYICDFLKQSKHIWTALLVVVEWFWFLALGPLPGYHLLVKYHQYQEHNWSD